MNRQKHSKPHLLYKRKQFKKYKNLLRSIIKQIKLGKSTMDIAYSQYNIKTYNKDNLNTLFKDLKWHQTHTLSVSITYQTGLSLNNQSFVCVSNFLIENRNIVYLEKEQIRKAWNPLPNFTYKDSESFFKLIA